MHVLTLGVFLKLSEVGGESIQWTLFQATRIRRLVVFFKLPWDCLYVLFLLQRVVRILVSVVQHLRLEQFVCDSLGNLQRSGSG